MNIFLIILLVVICVLLLWALTSSGSATPVKTPEDDLALRRRSVDRGAASRQDELTPERSGSRSTDKKEKTQEENYDRDVEVGEDFTLPNQPAGIIPLGSPFEVYRKTLANAEAYIKKGEFSTARSLYEGIHDRISDADIREKIEENLDYINNYYQVAAQRLETKRKRERTGEVRLTLEGAETLADRISVALSQPQGKLAEQGKMLDQYRDELAKVRNDLRALEREKKRELQSDEERIQSESEEIARLREELLSIKEERIAEKEQIQSPAREDELSQMIKLREEENDLLRERLSVIKKEMEMLSREKAHASAFEEKISTDISDLKKSVEQDDAHEKELSALREELSSMKNALSSMSVPPAHNPSTHSTESAEAHMSSLDLQDLTKTMKEGMETLSPLLKEALEKKDAADKEKKKEDEKKDDFQLMEELMHGQKYDEPTDEEVLEKILTDAVREQAKKKGRPEKKETEHESPDTDSDKESKGRKNKKDNHETRDDFELMSDYLKGGEGSEPTDEEVMEKILKDAMKSKDFRRSAGIKESPEGSVSGAQGGYQEPVKRRKELPILHVSYNFSRLPDEFTLSIDKNHLEYSFYKFKSLLEKASDHVKRRKVKDAINYYRVVMDQDIPQEFKDMLSQNIKDLNEYLTKYYTSG